MMSFNKTKNYLIVTVFLLLLSLCSAFSQSNDKEETASVFVAPDSLFLVPDSTSHFFESLFDYLDISALYINSTGTPEDFGFNPHLLPVVFDGKFADDLSIHLPDLLAENKKALFVLDTLYIQSKGQRFVDRLRRNAYRNLISQHIDLAKYTKKDFPEKVEKIVEVKPNPFSSIFKIDYDHEREKVEVDGRFKPKQIYWLKNGSSLIQFSQNYISDNWYKGGVGNLNLLSVQNYTANYKKDKVQFNNFIEWKLSFYTNPKDTLRSFRIGDDLLRYYGDFGVRAFNDKWFYSSNVEIKTQLFKNYKENSMEIISAFVSPLIVNVGILGIKFQTEKLFPRNKYKKINLSADISPLSIQYTYENKNEIDETRFGIEKGKNSLLDLGSTLNAKLIVNFNRQITFTSRFKLFTNYEKIIIESENELNISINRFFSTRLYLYPRFDDSPGVKKDEKFGYTQINEVLTFGFNFKW
jgi:hypothetical protein